MNIKIQKIKPHYIAVVYIVEGDYDFAISFVHVCVCICVWGEGGGLELLFDAVAMGALNLFVLIQERSHVLH